MDHLWKALVEGAPHLFAAVVIALATIAIEYGIKHYRRRSEIKRLSWLFPISQEKKPSMYFKCSLKPAEDFRPIPPTRKTGEHYENLYQEFFGKNPSTYRRYVHAAEVLALQQITEKLAPLGVQFLQSGFYGGVESSANLLLIGSGANTQISDTILDGIQARILYDSSPDGGHKFFKCGSQEYRCEEGKEVDGIKRVKKDCGIIVRRTYSDGRVVLLLAGIHMHGTLAAAQVAVSPHFRARVLKYKYKNFAQLVPVAVMDGLYLNEATVRQWESAPFINLD